MFPLLAGCSLWGDGSVVSTVFTVVFCVVPVPTIVFEVLLRWGETFPSVGRWLDERIYRFFPRRDTRSWELRKRSEQHLLTSCACDATPGEHESDHCNAYYQTRCLQRIPF